MRSNAPILGLFALLALGCTKKSAEDVPVLGQLPEFALVDLELGIERVEGAQLFDVRAGFGEIARLEVGSILGPEGSPLADDPPGQLLDVGQRLRIVGL